MWNPRWKDSGKWAARDFTFCPACVVALDIAILRELFLDLDKVLLESCDVHRCADGFQVGDLRLRLCELFGDGLISPLLFIVLVEIPLRRSPEPSSSDPAGS